MHYKKGQASLLTDIIDENLLFLKPWNDFYFQKCVFRTLNNNFHFSDIRHESLLNKLPHFDMDHMNY